MDAEFKDEDQGYQTKISAKENDLLKQWFSLSAQVQRGQLAPATATAITAMAEVSNPDLDPALQTNQTQHSVRLAITVKRRMISKMTAIQRNVMMHL